MQYSVPFHNIFFGALLNTPHWFDFSRPDASFAHSSIRSRACPSRSERAERYASARPPPPPTDPPKKCRGPDVGPRSVLQGPRGFSDAPAKFGPLGNRRVVAEEVGSGRTRTKHLLPPFPPLASSTSPITPSLRFPSQILATNQKVSAGERRLFAI